MHAWKRHSIGPFPDCLSKLIPGDLAATTFPQRELLRCEDQVQSTVLGGTIVLGLMLNNFLVNL